MGQQSSRAQFHDFVKPLIGIRAEVAKEIVVRYQDQAVSNSTIDLDGVKAILGDAVPDDKKDELLAPLGDVDVARRVVVLAIAGSDLSLTDQAFELTQLAVDYQSEDLGSVDAEGVAAVARAVVAAASAATSNLEGSPEALLEQAGSVAEKIVKEAGEKAAAAGADSAAAGGGGGKVDALEVAFTAAAADECASLMEFVSDAADEEFEAAAASGAGEQAGGGGDDEEADAEFDLDGEEYDDDYEEEGAGGEGDGEDGAAGDEGEGEGKEGEGEGGGEDGPTVETIGGKADDVGHLAVKPWEGAIKASEPAGWAGPDYEPPLCDLELEWVHGVACYDYRLDYNKTIYTSAIGYDATGRVVFPAGGMVVVQSTGEDSTQQYFTGHGRCRVTALAVSPDGRMAASGDRGAKPRVLIWSLEETEEDRSGGSGEVEDFFEDEASLKARNKRKAERAKRGKRNGPSSKYHRGPKKRLTKPRDPALSLKRVATIPLKHGMREIKALAWSPSGRRVGFACMDDSHTVYVYDVARGKMLLSATGSSAEYVCAVAFQDEDTLVVSDKRQVNFWDVRTGRSSRGISHPSVRGDPLLALSTVPAEGGAASGGGGGGRGRQRSAPSGTVFGVTAKGYAVKFGGRRMAEVTRVSRQPVFSLARNPANGKLMAGASDGSVAVISPDDLKVDKVIESLVTRGTGGKPVSKLNQVVALGISQDGTKAGAVLRSGRVMELDAGSGDLMHGGRPVVHGHWCPRVFSELWGVAAHPTEQRFVTTGDDNTVRLWDARKCAQLGEQDLGSLIRCVSFSQDGALIAVGFGGDLGGTSRGTDAKSGGFAVLDGNTLELMHESRRPLSKEWISDCKFSPDGNWLAVGSHDNCVYVLDVRNGYRVAQKLSKSSSFVVHFDWSANSKFIRVNDGAHELLFYDATTGRHIASPSEVKQERWASEHCTIQWATMAAHNETIDMNVVRACDLSKARGVLAVGDEKRQVRLFRFPACDEKQQSKVFGGHSSFVTNLRWLPGDERLVSVSGADRVVFQWKVDGPTDAEDFLAFSAAAGDAASRAARGGGGGRGDMNVGSAAVDGPEPEPEREPAREQAVAAPAAEAAAPAAAAGGGGGGGGGGARRGQEGSGCCVVS